MESTPSIDILNKWTPHLDPHTVPAFGCKFDWLFAVVGNIINPVNKAGRVNEHSNYFEMSMTQSKRNTQNHTNWVEAETPNINQWAFRKPEASSIESKTSEWSEIS